MSSRTPDIDNVGKQMNGRELDSLEQAKSSDEFRVSSVDDRPLRIAIVTENFLPCVDGVTRTLARLLEHLQAEGHVALVLGPESGMDSYAGHQVVGTKGIPLLGVYKGLRLNFLRPKFIRKLVEFKPDVIQFVDPIWLCAQSIPVIQFWLPHVPLLASYHTNIGSYASLFGFSWLSPTIWNLQRYLHDQCRLTFCPSPSTARMLESRGFSNVRQWPRGVDTALFGPHKRDFNLRVSWDAEPRLTSLDSSRETRSAPSDSSRRGSLELPGYSGEAPPPYTTNSPDRKVVMLYVGRLSWEKNLRLLVEAFRGLQHSSKDGSRPACQLVFVGDGPARCDLEALCAGYGLSAVFMGYRKGEELAAAFSSADIFAFPSWTETFGQVVLEALASGLPVVGLRAEGVCDLVEHEKTGLLLDLNQLLPTISADSLDEKPAAVTNALPDNPHVLLNHTSTTFPLAVSLYRESLVKLASNHERREAMGTAAAESACKRSWFGAMEMLVDGYREICIPAPPSPSLTGLTLSRTSTMEVDVITHLAETDTAQTSAASTRTKRPVVGRVLRLGGVFRRTGGRLKEGSMSRPIRTWLVGRTERVEEDLIANSNVKLQSTSTSNTRWLIKLALLLYGLYVLSVLANQFREETAASLLSV